MGKIIISEGIDKAELIENQIANAPVGLSKHWANAVDITISNGDFIVTKKGEEYEALEK